MSGLPMTYNPDFHQENAVSQMQYVDFGSTGLKVSKLSFGAAGFSKIYGNFTIQDCEETLMYALKSGVNYIDTAPWYGQGTSEETLGICLRNVPRSAYYIATKVGRYETDPHLMFDFSAEKTRQSIEDSLNRLQLEYVDVIQIHDIEFAPSIDYVIKETLPVLQEAVNEGKAKFIGITGYPVSVLSEFLNKSPVKIDTVLSYSRLTLFDDSLTKYQTQFKGMAIINAAALGMGLLTNEGPPFWHPASKQIKDACQEAAIYCKKNKVQLARLALHFVYQNQFPYTHLAGMKRISDIQDNLDVLLNGISKEEAKVLDYLRAEIFGKLDVSHWEGVELINLAQSRSSFINL